MAKRDFASQLPETNAFAIPLAHASALDEAIGELHVVILKNA